MVRFGSQQNSVRSLLKFLVERVFAVHKTKYFLILDPGCSNAIR